MCYFIEYLYVTVLCCQGRWWIVGSAWTGRDGDNDDASKLSRLSNIPEDSTLLKIAKKQRMNTEIRKNIFCVIMTSEVS